MKKMNHAAYQAGLKTKSNDELHAIMIDCFAVMKAIPDNENNGYYADEINYCVSELYRRAKATAIKEGTYHVA